MELSYRLRHNGKVSCGFETVDIYGVPVSCSHDTWDGHVLARHSDLTGLGHLAIETIIDPDLVYDSGRRPNRKLFYREARQPPPFSERYILVIVAYDDLPEGVVGVVVTAYPIEGLSESDEGDTLAWQR